MSTMTSGLAIVRRAETVVLIVVAALLGGWSVVDAGLHDWWGAPAVAAVLVILAGTLPLAFLRRVPVLAALVVNVAVVAFGVGWGTPNTAPPYLSLFVATFAVGAFTPRRPLLWVALGALVTAVQLLDRAEHDAADLVWVLGTWAVTLVVGVLVSEREGHEQRDRASAETTRAEAGAAADRGIVVERARIAQDLLDVVTRGVDTMLADTSLGRAESVAGRPGAAANALSRVEATGQGALAELRRMLDVMRGSLEPSTEPQPGLEALEALIARSVAEGWPTRADLRGRVDEVPPGVGVAAYRIVQEALDDVHRCAPGAAVGVQVTAGPHDVVVEVRDSGPALGRSETALRQRMEVYGGRLDIGPLDSGWRVRAVFPR